MRGWKGRNAERDSVEEQRGWIAEADNGHERLQARRQKTDLYPKWADDPDMLYREAKKLSFTPETITRHFLAVFCCHRAPRAGAD
jgi:hypothetical protein